MTETVTEEQEPEVNEAAEAVEETNDLSQSGARKLALYKEVSHKLVALQKELKASEEEIKAFKNELKTERESRDSIIGLINSRLSDLQDIENGCYQPSLFVKSDDDENAGPVDPAFDCSISCLGLSEKEVDLLESADIKMIADLEKKMREDRWWHKNVKGFGQAKVDKLTDALLDWRLRNPVPSEEEEDDDDEDLSVAEQDEQEAEDAQEPDNENDESGETIPMHGSDVKENLSE